MMQKWWELCCDNCGTTIQNYIGNKPTIEEIKRNGFVVHKSFVFCDMDCYNEFINK